jgi:hypothetical protein
LGSFYANGHFLRHAVNWGWDNTDLLWEANLTASGPPVYVLRFRDDFNFGPVFARLTERGYTRLEHEGIPLYSHDFDLSVDWLRTSEFAILNIAFVEAEKIFMMASSPDTVAYLLDSMAAGSTLAVVPGVVEAAAALGHAGAALISPLGCQPMDVGSLIGSSPEEVRAMWEEWQASGIHGLFTVLALGYRVEEINGEQVPLGVFAHYYPLAAQAYADLEPRRILAESGQSLSREGPYADLFGVVRAEVVETGTGAANLVLALAARERPPHLFFQMVYSRDLLFAACGS